MKINIARTLLICAAFGGMIANVARACTGITLRSKDGAVVGVIEENIGIVTPIHLIATEPSGKAIVIEFTDGADILDVTPGS